MRRVAQKGAKIEKPEDKEWLKWYNNLSQKDHEQYLAKLGLTEEDKKDLEEVKQELKKAKVEAEEEEVEK